MSGIFSDNVKNVVNCQKIPDIVGTILKTVGNFLKIIENCSQKLQIFCPQNLGGQREQSGPPRPYHDFFPIYPM